MCLEQARHIQVLAVPSAWKVLLQGVCVAGAVLFRYLSSCLLAHLFLRLLYFLDSTHVSDYLKYHLLLLLQSINLRGQELCFAPRSVGGV